MHPHTLIPLESIEVRRLVARGRPRAASWPFIWTGMILSDPAYATRHAVAVGASDPEQGRRRLEIHARALRHQQPTATPVLEARSA
jgi:hypothetical protein